MKTKNTIFAGLFVMALLTGASILAVNRNPQVTQAGQIPRPAEPPT